jgi:hypothetical protein
MDSSSSTGFLRAFILMKKCKKCRKNVLPLLKIPTKNSKNKSYEIFFTNIKFLPDPNYHFGLANKTRLRFCLE